MRAINTNPTVMIYARTAASGPQARKSVQRDVRRLESLAATLTSRLPTIVVEQEAWKISGNVADLATTFDIVLITGIDRLGRYDLRLDTLLRALNEHRTQLLSPAEAQQLREGHSPGQLDLAAQPMTPDRFILDDLLLRQDDEARDRFRQRTARGRVAAADSGPDGSCPAFTSLTTLERGH